MSTTHLPVIGKHETIDLSKEGVFNVPAKIDTGADKCAIWATSITEKNGVLSFCLFGPGSALYTGIKIKTTEYATTPVKNSFGVTELRYMVKFSIRLGKKTYRVRFTLADRSRNKFPVLLGMNLLKNRFWVNVAENYLQSGSKKQTNRNVLILSAVPDPKRAQYFGRLKPLHKKATNYQLVTLDELVFWFGERPSITIGTKGKDIKDFALAYFKSYKSAYELGVSAADYLHYENVRVIDDEVLTSVSTSKLSEMVRMNCHAIPIPKGVAMATDLFKKNYSLLTKNLGTPFVLKDIYSERGRNNYLISNKKEYDEVLTNAPAACYFVAQEYIQNDGFLRLLVLNKEIPVIIKRTTYTHSNKLKAHLNKPAGGMNANLITSESMSEISALAMRAALIMGRPVCGVDALQDKLTKKWYILEANASPQLIGDKYEAEKAQAFAKFIDYELERS